jgi:hypothetical protein
MNAIEKLQLYNKIYDCISIKTISNSLLKEAIDLKNELEEEAIQYQCECEWIDERHNAEITDKDIDDMHDYYNKEIYK